MVLTKKQKEAISKTPLHLGQSESNLNHFYWTDSKGNAWFTCKTVDILIEKGLLCYALKGITEDTTTVINKQQNQK